MHRVTPLIALPSGEVHLWFCRHGESGDAALETSFHSLLSEEEAIGKKRFHFARDRYRYLLTRVLLRTVLSRYAPVLAAAWRFAAGPFGRPHIASPELTETRGLDFNLSHTDGLILLGVSRDVELGVDTENVHRAAALEVVDHFFSPCEATALRALPEALRKERFFELWTLKESYIKARGMGLQIPLDSFGFALEEPGRIGFALHDARGDAGQGWHFRQLRPTAQHMVAICTANDGPIVCRDVAPLQWEHPREFEVTRAGGSRPTATN